MIRSRRWLFLPLLAAASATLPALPAAAQDSEAQSFFQAFFWSSDPLGLAIIWLLLIMSAVSIALSIRFALQYRKTSIVPEETRLQIEALLAEKKYRDAIDYASADPTYLGRVTANALNEAGNGYGAMERAVEEAGDAESSRMVRPLEYLNVLGNIAPMIGLFGTVYGMIVAFQELVAAGGQPDPAALAAGISTALVTTFWGLIVAIPALAAYAMIRNRVDALSAEGMLIAEDLISPFKPSGKKKSRDRERSSGGSSSSRSDRPTPQPEE